MRFVIIGVVIVLVAGLRLWMRRRRNRRREAETGARAPSPRRRWIGSGPVPIPFGDAGLVALREIRERVRSRIFIGGTLVILVGVAAAIVIPTVHKTTSPPLRVGVVGTVTPTLTKLVHAAGGQNATSVQIVPEGTWGSAEDALRSGTLDVALGSDRIVVNQPVSSDTTSPAARLVQTLSVQLGTLHAFQAARLSPAQIQQIAHARPIEVQSLQHGTTKPVHGSSVIGIILLFVMLTQYNTWILMGVMQEKASRVVEVLLATVRPIQLLGGKVLGIGLVAMGQAALIVSVALIVGAAVGSDLLHGTAPLELVSQLLWLLLGYAFYCWVYAAAGSMAERQDQVQTLVLPLTLPILLGYVLSITAASTGDVSLFFRVLAYLPPTAPFAMPVLVGLGEVSWWQFVASVVITIVGTYFMARFAAAIYRRAVLQSGQRVRIRDLRAAHNRRPAGAAG